MIKNTINSEEPLGSAAAKLLCEKMEEYGKELHDDTYVISFCRDDSVPSESYRISKNEKTLSVSASCLLGMYYGAGRVLHYIAPETNDPFCRIEEKIYAPEKIFRCVYYPTHFGNFWNCAPLKLINDMTDEYLLWGMNTVSVWFDMHHYTGIDDKNATEMLDRLASVSAHASSRGIKFSFGSISNEYWTDGPLENKATNKIEGTPYHSMPLGFYNCELCPSKKGSQELLNKAREEILSFFKKRNGIVDYCFIGAYDQGGCTCAECYPWGSNGWIRSAKSMAEIEKKFYPEAKVYLNTWGIGRFLKDEWAYLYPVLLKERGWIDGLEAEFTEKIPREFENGRPFDAPLVGFSEISMGGQAPYGAYGSNPRPCYIEKMWSMQSPLFDGSATYSEGIYCDLNTVAYMQMTYEGKSVKQSVYDYACFYFGSNVAEDVVRLAYDLEKTDARTRYNAEGKPEDWPKSGAVKGVPTIVIRNPESIETAYRNACKISESMSFSVRYSWRWRMLWLRAAIDMEFLKNDWHFTDFHAAYFTEIDIMSYTREAIYAAKPLTPDAIRFTKDGLNL